MKLLCVEYNDKSDETFVPVGDNALLRNNDDFYLPAFANGEISGVLQLVLRVSKIGKCVAERFASRYYDAVGLGIRFQADALANELKRKDMSPILASAFDSSAAISSMGCRPEELPEYALWLNGHEIFRGTVANLPNSPEQVIAKVSAYYMLKIGDFIFCGNPFRVAHLRQGDHLQAFLGTTCLLDFHVR